MSYNCHGLEQPIKSGESLGFNPDRYIYIIKYVRYDCEKPVKIGHNRSSNPLGDLKTTVGWDQSVICPRPIGQIGRGQCAFLVARLPDQPRRQRPPRLSPTRPSTTLSLAQPTSTPITPWAQQRSPPAPASVTVPVHAVDDGLVDPTLTGAFALASSTSSQYVIATDAAASANFESSRRNPYPHHLLPRHDPRRRRHLYARRNRHRQSRRRDRSHRLQLQHQPDYSSTPTATLSNGVETVTAAVTALAVGVSPIGAFDPAGNASALQDVTVNPPSPPDGLNRDRHRQRRDRP